MNCASDLSSDLQNNIMDADSDLELSPSEHRKTTKPIMEKRRRARINASLTELKSLLLEVMKKEGTRHHKMEKADILEMTVKHLRQLQRTQFTAAVTSDPSVLNKYQSGFAECASEVSRYLASVDTQDADLKARLLNHLANTIQRPNTSPVPMTVTSSVGPLTAHVRPTPIQPTILTASDQGSPINLSTKVTTIVPEINNNTIPASQGFMPAVAAQPAPQQTTAKLVSGVQLIPSRLPSGEVAFVIPGNVLATSQMSNYVIPLYAGPAPAQPQISPPAGTSRPMVVSPSVPVSLPQAPIMILPSPSLSPASDNTKTSPDSSTNHLGVDIQQELTASPTLRDSTNRNIQFQHNNDLDMKMESEHLKAPAQVAQPAPLADENMWRPW